MPTYEFICTKCGVKIETGQISFEKSEENLKKLQCARCGGAYKRKLAPFVTHFNYTRGKKEK
jgi:putative FmdB family regulatory protein